MVTIWNFGNYMHSNNTVKEVVIVGGGTSGWITAAYLAKTLNCKAKNAIKVTLVESEDIGTIGVGEGTFPTIKTTLQFLGISESEFIREADATFKQAIKFDHWQYDPKTHQGRNDYFHLFDVPKGAPYFDISPFWLAHGQQDFDESVSAQTKLCRNNQAPKKITTKEFDGLNYAYHLDAVKFARFLRKHSIEKLGVKHQVATIDKVNLDDDAFIASVETKDGQTIKGDFFVDCSGFRSLLIGETYNVDFESTQKYLFVDNAIAIQVPYPEKDSPIATHTISTAHEAGWTWDIGLSGRRGVGYVYSSAHTSHERAEQVLREYIGKNAEGLQARRIPMKTGYRTKQWHKNCVAIGLSAGFIEPLESTAIAMIELAAKLLSEEFPYSKQAFPILEKQFNDVFIYRWQAIIDFVKLHYLLSKRTDSQFWIDNTNPASAPRSLLDKLAKWQLSPPTRNDFPSIYDIFGLESHQYVLYGMGFKPDISLKQAAMDQQEGMASNYLQQLAKQEANLSAQLPKQRQLIEQIKQHGLSKL